MFAFLKNWAARLMRGGRSAAGIVVEVYSRPECHLCDEAKAQLRRLQRRHGFVLREVDISADARLLAEYGTRIPLVWINGRLACKYHVEDRDFLRKLRAGR
ncbi:MAG: glutaredoxin family protein [candidate division KSB1 bacterium]|nr:glutaredoxin family protein [candidate division KSB1 bacterium]MDZ7274622.1 glutaredoxin family protein [candidate division KSB1 bacterium]MDZ7285447.1 glutaredoxin family protein [candidate division KSB1 bacterium]MDZ7298479.1 glutaredoxin family protein [candidate division KSB1 bacterium]MDZ7306963.1 glutaredoxin family protein [candidate division KSB1 bacterium]